MVHQRQTTEKGGVQPKIIPSRSQPAINSSYNNLINAGLTYGTVLLRKAVSTNAFKRTLVNQTIGFGIGIGIRTEKLGGLVPVGDSGLYASPSTPADPEDCVHYPTSPFCGNANPMQGFGLGLAQATFSLVINDCDIGIRYDGTFVFIKTPPLTIVYREPKCRPQHLDKNALSTRDDYEETIKIPDNYQDNDNVCVVLYLDYVYREFATEVEILNYERPLLQDSDNISRAEIESSVFLDGFEHPYKGNKRFYDGHDYNANEDIYRGILSKIDYKTSVRYRLNKTYGVKTGFHQYEDSEYYRNLGLHKPWEKEGDEYVGKGEFTGINITPDKYYNNDGFYNLNFYAMLTDLPRYAAGDIPPHILQVEEEDIWYGNLPLFYQGKYYYFATHHTQKNPVGGQGFIYIGSYGRVKSYLYQTKNFKRTTSNEYANNVEIQHWTCLINGLQKAPPPPTFTPEDNMACCPETNRILRELKKKVDKLSEIVGVEEYPISVPTSLISKDEGFIGNLIPNSNIEISNLTKFHAWYVERFDEIMGQFEIPIEVKDADPTTPGDQPKGIKLPNVAESIAEIFLLLLQTSIDTQTLVNIATRTMLEGGQDKQQNYISYRLLQSLVDWAGFKVREDKEELPMLFTPGKTKFEELLKETKVSIPVVEFDEKHSLEADLMRFRKAASILDAVHYKKVDPFGNIKDQLMKNLKDRLAVSNGLNSKEDEEFEKFIEDVEKGFSTQVGIDDPAHPYGREYNERPKIRDLTTFNPPTEL